MKTLVSSLSLCVLFLFATSAFAQTGAEYYPLGLDDFWVYKHISPKDSTVIHEPDKREVVSYQVDGENKIFGVKNTYAGVSDSYAWYKTLPEGIVVMFSLGTGPDLGSALMDFDPPLIILPEKLVVGSLWEIKMTDSVNKLFTMGISHVESTGETVTVPAGKFQNCLKVKLVTFYENGKEKDVSYNYYAKGVGEVLSEQVEPESERSRSELTEYSVK
jgi:hypothetical protein